MAITTINDLSSIATVATNDEIAVWDTDAAATKSATVQDVLVTRLTGTGTVATSSFTLTVPATGTAALLGTANTFTQLNTFSAGIAFANETMSTYDIGTWPSAPVIAGSSTPGTQTYSVQLGYYIRIGTFVIAWCQVNLSAKDAATAGNIQINNLPFTARNITNMRYSGSVGNWTSTATNFVSMTARVSANTSIINLFGATAATATIGSVVAADIGASTSFSVSVMYEAA